MQRDGGRSGGDRCLLHPCDKPTAGAGTSRMRQQRDLDQAPFWAGAIQRQAADGAVRLVLDHPEIGGRAVVTVVILLEPILIGDKRPFLRGGPWEQREIGRADRAVEFQEKVLVPRLRCAQIQR